MPLCQLDALVLQGLHQPAVCCPRTILCAQSGVCPHGEVALPSLKQGLCLYFQMLLSPARQTQPHLLPLMPSPHRARSQAELPSEPTIRWPCVRLCAWRPGGEGALDGKSEALGTSSGPVTSGCVTLGKLHSLSEPVFLICKLSLLALALLFFTRLLRFITFIHRIVIIK